MNKNIYTKIVSNGNCNVLTLFCKDKDIFIDVAITLPQEASKFDAEKLLLLSCFKIIEPFVRCGIKFNIISEYDFIQIIENISTQTHIDEELYLYYNLDWMKNNAIMFSNETSNVNCENFTGYFYNKNTIVIYTEKLSKLYSAEINKTLPFAIYERKRSKCDYAWRCSECPEGLQGQCEAIVYEEYVKSQNL